MNKMTPTRREWLRGAAGAGVALLARRAFGAAAGEPAGKRPNLIFIMTDDQAAYAMGGSDRFPFLKTPNLDRLASEGVRFENAFVTTALCSPSRATMLTGCYAHRHGVRVNDESDPDPGAPYLPELLRQAGYETAFIGKWHMETDYRPRPGFDYWLSFKGQGDYINPKLNENGREFEQEGYVTDILNEAAVKFIRREHEKPFCLFLWHKAMHGPFTPAERHKNLYEGATLPEPPSWRDSYEGKPEWYRRGIVYNIFAPAWQQSEGKPVPKNLPVREWDGREHLSHALSYLRTLSAVDDGVGLILDTLKETGLDDNTCVLFTSDNGYQMGDHASPIDKRVMYEPSIRVPMLMRCPGLSPAAKSIPQMVLNNDVAPTLLDLAGAPVPKEMQGRSFAPLLRGEDVAWRDSWMYEYFAEDWAPGIVDMVGVRTSRYKYIHYPNRENDIDELYDLETDPHEMNNRIADPAMAEELDRLKQELERLKKETGYRLR